MQLTAVPRRSRVWLLTILVAFALGIVSLLAADFGSPWFLPLLALLLVVVALDAFLRWRAVPDRLEFGMNSEVVAPRVRVFSGDQTEDWRIREARCWRWLVVLDLVPDTPDEPSNSKRKLVLPIDALDRDAFRRLIVLLRSMRFVDAVPE